MFPLRSRLGRSVLGGGAGLGLAVLLATQPVLATECMRPAAFSPGAWYGSGAYYGAVEHDGATEITSSRDVEFILIVNDSGAAKGDLNLSGGGVMEGKQADINSVAAWSVEAELSGGPIDINAEGTLTMSMQGVIAIGTENDPLEGPTHMGAGGGLEKETSFSFYPDASNCVVASGDFGDNFRIRTSDLGDVPLTWIAFRVLNGGNSERLRALYQELVDEAFRVLNAPEPHPDDLRLVVRRLTSFNNVLAQPKYCTSVPADLQPGTHANVLAQQLLGATLGRTMAAALEGSYTTGEVISIMTLGLEAAALDVPQCGSNPSQVNGDRAALMGLFHAVLEQRLYAARDNGDKAEEDLILAAAYQFGLYEIWKA